MQWNFKGKWNDNTPKCRSAVASKKEAREWAEERAPETYQQLRRSYFLAWVVSSCMGACFNIMFHAFTFINKSKKSNWHTSQRMKTSIKSHVLFCGKHVIQYNTLISWEIKLLYPKALYIFMGFPVHVLYSVKSARFMKIRSKGKSTLNISTDSLGFFEYSFSMITWFVKFLADISYRCFNKW